MIFVAERLSKVFLLALRYISAFFLSPATNLQKYCFSYLRIMWQCFHMKDNPLVIFFLFVCFFKQIPLIHSSEPLSIVTIESIFSGSKITAALHFKVICLYEDKLQNFTHQASG